MGLFSKKKEGKTAEEWFELGLKEKDPKKQIEYYSKCLELDPKYAVAWNNKGNALAELGRYEEALRCYDKALEIDPKHVLAWYNKGVALHKLGRYEEALRCYDKALEIDPKHAYAWYNKGLALYKLGRHEEAIRCYGKALEIDPKDVGGWENKGVALRNLGRYEEAMRCYDRMLEIGLKDADAWKHKGVALLKLGRYEEAIGCYDRALEIDPKDAVAWHNKGYALYDLRRYEEALRCYDKALEIDPKYADAWNNKGIALDDLGRYEEALRCYDKALEIDPKYADAWYNKGDALHNLGRYEEAIGCYDRALEIDPKDAEAWNNKGNALADLGRYEEALRCYDKALEIDPKHERAKNNKKLAEEKLKEESKPEMEVVLPEKTFKPNYWKRLNLIVRNKGNAHAKAVKIEFSKEVEVKGLKELNINSGEEEKLSIILKPNELGDVPLEIKTTYKDADGKEYSAENLFMLNVTDKPAEEKKEEEKKRARKKVPAFFPAELEAFYRDIEYIGEGGFARIFKAVRIKDSKEVAVKIPISLDPETGKAFTKEISNWNLLGHENIVELYDVNILPIPYLEMELCDRSLEEVPKPMEVEDAASIIFDLAKGLKHAHSKGIIHRDLKPSNILFKHGKVKISDWGLSKLKASSKSSSIIAFSPLYAAPEHLSKSKFGKTDERTDIYQLGIVFYELVAGKLPFEGEDVAGISFSIISEQPVPPSEINPKSKGVEHIIMKCMAKRKEERYQSVDELIEDLAVYLKEEYKKSRDFRKSAFFLYELLLQSVERGDTVEAVGWATEGLLNYPKRKYSEKEVQMLKNAVKVLMDIKRNYCSENAKVEDVNRKYDELKDNLFEDFVEEIERDKDLGMVIREMNAELREDERLEDKHVRNLEYFCVKFVKRWIAKFLR